MVSYAVMLVLGLVLNIGNRKMLALTGVVGAGVFAPVPAENFYLICALGEMLIGCIALKLDSPASRMIARISWLLIIFHVMGFAFDGYPVTSPYHLLVKISEHAELLACILFSEFRIKRLSKHG